MNSLFLALFLLAIAGWIVGAIKPSWVKLSTRKSVSMWFGGAVLVSFILFGITSSDSTAPATIATTEAVPSSPAVTPGAAPVPASQPTVKKTPIAYQIVDRWTIPNGGEGKVVVISPDLLNESDMVALGNKLKSDTQGDRNAFISVFDNASAAALRNKVLSQKATTAEQDLYDKHFVGQYDRNANTGYHQFAIHFDGIMGTNGKTIQY